MYIQCYISEFIFSFHHFTTKFSTFFSYQAEKRDWRVITKGGTPQKKRCWPVALTLLANETWPRFCYQQFSEWSSWMDPQGKPNSPSENFDMQPALTHPYIYIYIHIRIYIYSYIYLYYTYLEELADFTETGDNNLQHHTSTTLLQKNNNFF